MQLKKVLHAVLMVNKTVTLAEYNLITMLLQPNILLLKTYKTNVSLVVAEEGHTEMLLLL